MEQLKCDDTCGCQLREKCLGRRLPDLFGVRFRGLWESGDPVLRMYVVDRSEGRHDNSQLEAEQQSIVESRSRQSWVSESIVSAGYVPYETPKVDTSAIMARHRELLQLVHECDRRGQKIGCGCNERRFCAEGRGMFQSDPCAVTLSDCIRCVSSKW